jgi:predicted phage tail protein
MTYRSTWRSKSGIYLFSVILAAVIVNSFLRTPNTVGGGGSMMILILVLAAIFKITIEFFLTRRQKNRDAKRDDKTVV